jgi:hypothetical protein
LRVGDFQRACTLFDFAHENCAQSKDLSCNAWIHHYVHSKFPLSLVVLEDSGMRRKATIILGMLYLLVMMQPFLPRLLFSLNQSYIQTELCQQRHIKANTCEGACFLRKQLQQQQQGSRELPALVCEKLELLQLVPQASGTLVVPDDAVPTFALTFDTFLLDQHVADLPVPPPWIS